MAGTPPTPTTPPGSIEGFVQLPTDGSGKQLRMFPVAIYQQQTDGTFSEQTAYQQVAVIADAAGNLLGVQDSPLHVQTSHTDSLLSEIRDLLQELKERLS